MSQNVPKLWFRLKKIQAIKKVENEENSWLLLLHMVFRVIPLLIVIEKYPLKLFTKSASNAYRKYMITQN